MSRPASSSRLRGEPEAWQIGKECGIFAGLWLMLIILLFSGLVQYVPLAVIAGIGVDVLIVDLNGWWVP